MVQKSTSWTKALFVGIWTALNFCRKLFFNVIFIVIIVGIFMVASKEDQTVKVTQNSALVLTLNGSLVIEKTAIDPAEQFFQQALNEEPEDPEVLIRDIISVLDNAKQDKRITALILDLQGLRRAGLNKLRTVAEAIDDFKKVIEIDPESANAYNNLAWLYADLETNLDQAVGLAKKQSG